MTREKRYPLWALLHAFRLMGLDVSRVLKVASLYETLQQDDAASGVADDLYRLYAAALQEDDRPDFGLRLAVTFTRVPCGVSHYGFHAAATFGDALQLLIRYKSDTAPERLSGFADGRRFELHHLNPRPETGSLGALLSFAWLVEMQRVTYREAISPNVVTLSQPVPNIELYEQHLGCHVDIGTTNSIEFDRAALTATPLTRDLLPTLVGSLEGAALRVDESAQGPQFADVVVAVIQRNIESGKIGVKDIAVSLGTSARTLQRRLAAEGLSLTMLQENVRRELALRLLQGAPTKTAEVARRLGYQDPGAFFKAFKGWYGITPAQYRRGNGEGA